MNENMILNLGGSGGGAALNFKVVGNPQPESAKENTIWLNTDVPIGAWYFNAAQPENLNDGDVWFPIGTSSSVEFNALKKNGIQVYPIRAKQMVSGSLVDVKAKSYQGGEWVDWILWLYKDGNQYTDITGGWSATTENAMGISFGNNIEITWNGGTSIGGYFNINNQIDLTNKSRLHAQCLIASRYDASRYIEIALCKNLPSNFVYTADSIARLTTMNAEQQISADVSSLTGKYYIVVNCAGITGKIGDIGLE